jgi:hypothetical protein
MGTVAQVVLDDTDVTEFCVSGSVTPRLNRISQASVTINMEELAPLYGTMIPRAGSMLRVYFQNSVLGTTPVLFHHGRVMQREIDAAADTGYATFNSSDPLELWLKRPVRDDDGDFTKPTLVETYHYGPQIIEAMVNNSEAAGGGPPSDAEGPTRLAINFVAAGITELKSVPTNWPMTMAEFAALLISTNTVDVVVTPIEFDGFGNYGQLDLYNGDFGQDLTSSVQFAYGMGDFSIQQFRWSDDMADVCNKLWYYLGPRRKTPKDYQGNQHWAANVQGDDPGLAYPPGGGTSPPHSATNNPIGQRRYLSQQSLDVRMEIKIYDALGDEAADGRELYRRLWQEESYLRAYPRQLVHITPARDVGIGEFGVGDLIFVEASSKAAGGFSGAQRVYEYTVSWDQDSVPSIGELQVSSDQQGFP